VTDDGTLFDLPERKQYNAIMGEIVKQRDNAIDTVEAHANEDWAENAYITGMRLARHQTTLMSEDIWDAMNTTEQTHEPRAMGAVMRRLHRDRVITPTEVFTRSTSPRGHGRPSRIWESLIARGTTNIGN
jgi:hypothetical protein